MTLDRIAAIAADVARDATAYAATVDIFDGFHPRPFILGIVAGLIAPTAVRLLAWML